MVHESTNDYVLLLRVSTTKQGADGNGIEAQRRDIGIFLQQQENPRVVKEFVEVISGSNSSRPVLDEAIATAKRFKCPLLVQKVDRLTRDVETLGRLTKDKNLQLKIASLPNADNFQIHLYGILAAQEKLFISQRTKAAMAASKARYNTKFGNPNLRQLNQTRAYKAKQFADKHYHIIQELRDQNKTYREICNVLNKSGIKTRNGNTFNPIQIHRILKRSSEVLKNNVQDNLHATAI